MSNLFQNKFSERDFALYVSEYIPDFNPTDSRNENRRGFVTVKQIGESRELDLVIFAVTPEASINARMEISKLSYALLKTHPRAHALIAYHSQEADEWRLSLITTKVTRDKSGVKESVSNPRRFSYVLGPKAKVNTPTKYLISKGRITDLIDLKERFSLEVVNKDFYREISNLFTKLTGGTLTAGSSKKEFEALLQLPSVPERDQRNLEFAVRLIGRVIFCWFLREKKSSAGIALMPKELLSRAAVDSNPDYYHSILEPIFFEVLNKEVKSRKDRYVGQPFSSIPYLNGGLFSPEYDDYFSYNESRQAVNHDMVVVPDIWIEEFFEFLETFNFTIDENVSFDEELSIDPEMLGRIFENLLAEINPETGESARRRTGSYYTPRSIVDFMVDESLLVYLKDATSIEEEKLRAVISYDLEDNLKHPLSEKELEQVTDALSKVRILDPACGSGAFPIGALQKIVFILQQVDPDGRKWFERQFENTAPEIRRIIEREFADRNFNYIRKIGVIRENIFGVDIQPIATEISRLRCFLTLIVEESIHDELENRGIEPLPNLDFKFVTANALIQLPGTRAQTLFKDQERIDQLMELRNQFFSSTSSERQRLQLEFKEIQNQMLNRMIETKGEDEATRYLSTWNPFSHKTTPWFDPEWMFGVEGFDVIIANPPYVSHDKITNKEYFQNNYESYSAFADLYCFFVERALTLQNATGSLCYITSNSYLRADYGRPLRKLLVEKNYVLSITNIEDFQVFDAAIVNTAILITQSKKNAREPKCAIVNSPYTDDVPFDTFVKERQFFYEQRDLHDKSWSLLPLDQLALKRRIESSGKTLEKYGAKIRMGIATGANKAFVIDGSTRNKLIKEDPNSAEIIKPVLGGKDIFRYRYLAADKYILLTANGIDVENAYPAVYAYLDSFGEDFKKRGARGQHWSNLRATAFLDDFKQEKIIWIELSDRGRFALCTEEIYLLNSAYFLIPPPNLKSKFLLALLNSKLIEFYLGLIAETSGMGVTRWINNHVKEFPIPDASTETQEQLIGLVDAIYAVTSSPDYSDDEQKKSQVSKFEEQIDQIVYQLYRMTAEEISIIEKRHRGSGAPHA